MSTEQGVWINIICHGLEYGASDRLDVLVQFGMVYVVHDRVSHLRNTQIRLLNGLEHTRVNGILIITVFEGSKLSVFARLK